jgi:plasmid stabilization system protein ParE
LVQEFRDAAASLSEFADRGQIVPEFSDETIREFLVTPYRVVYRVSPERVAILALVHGATRIRRP